MKLIVQGIDNGQGVQMSVITARGEYYHFYNVATTKNNRCCCINV